MVDFAAFVAEATRVVREQKGSTESVACELVVWDHARPGGVTVEFKVWDGTDHYVAGAPELALAYLKAAYAVPATVPPLADMDAVTLPDAA